MSTITGSSTLEEIRTEYLANASYAEDASTAKAKAFVTACTALLLALAERQVHGGRGGGQEIQFNLELIAKEKSAAQTWLAGADESSAGGGGIVHADLSGFRN